MKISVYQGRSDDALAVLEGELDAASVPLVHAELDGLASAGIGNLILDLGGVDFVDSSGAGVLVFLHKRLAAQSRVLALVGVTGQPLSLLTLLRLETVIPVNGYSPSDLAEIGPAS